MKIYLAHETADAAFASDVTTALQGAGHHIYRRSGTLEAGQAITNSVRLSISKSDFFIFIASPASTAQGTLSLSDLVIAHEKWRDPKGRILVLRTTDQNPGTGATMLTAFPQAGPVNSAKDVLALVTGQYGLRRGKSRWRAAAAVAAATALVLGGAAFYFTHAVKQAGKTERAEPAGNVEFAVDVDYSATMDFGETRHFKLAQTAGEKFAYRCKAGPSPSPNIATVTHDEQCADIKVTASDGPFVDADGKPYERGNYYPDRDLVPVSIETLSGTEVFRTSFPFSVSNSATTFLLRGLDVAPQVWPSDTGNDFIISPGGDYELEVLTRSGSPIPEAWTCAAQPMGQYEQRKYSITPIKGCKFKIANAQTGGLWIVMSRTNPEHSHELLFDLVDSNWKPMGGGDLSSVGVTSDEMRDGLNGNQKRLAAWLSDREARMAKGEIQDDWYLGYLRHKIAGIESALKRLDTDKPGGEFEDAAKDYRKKSLLEQIEGVKSSVARDQQWLDKRLKQVQGMQLDDYEKGNLDQLRQQIDVAKAQLGSLSEAYEKEFGEAP